VVHEVLEDCSICSILDHGADLSAIMREHVFLVVFVPTDVDSPI
jgi:hypothetical protein